MNNIEKHQFKVFLIQNKCYQAFKYEYKHSRSDGMTLRRFLNYQKVCDPICAAFSWMLSKQGYDFWLDIHKAWQLQLSKNN